MASKATMLQSTVIGIIAIVVTVGLLAYGIIQRSSDSNEVAMHQACGVSVAAQSIKVPLANNPLELNCRTETGVIDGTKTEALEEISKDALECWVQFGQGQVDFLKNWRGVFRSSSPRICYICSQKTFKNKMMISWNDIYSYMKTHGPKGQTWKYSDAIPNLDGGKYLLDQAKKRRDELSKKLNINEENKYLAMAVPNPEVIEYVALTEKISQLEKAVRSSQLYDGVEVGPSKALYVVYAGQKSVGGFVPVNFIIGRNAEYTYFLSIGTPEDLSANEAGDKLCDAVEPFSYYETK